MGNGQFKPKHGLESHPFYPTWSGMVSRCCNPKSPAYKDYGGRGITVCDEWRHDPTDFIAWLEDNGYGKGLHIDRIDNDSGYYPENCRVATPRQNACNRRSNRKYMLNGEMLTASQIERRHGVKAATFAYRVNKIGRTPEEALENRQKLPQYEWEVMGKLMSTRQIEQAFGVPRKNFIKRVNRGWNANRAAMTPVGG